MRFITLDYIVRDICIIQLQDSACTQYMRVARGVRQALIQVQMNFMPALKSVQVQVDENYICQLPSDVSIITKVGILRANGKMSILLENRMLRQVQQMIAADEPLYCECEVPPEDTAIVPVDAESCNVFHNCTWGNGFYGELYAAHGGIDYDGSWRHNIEAGVLEMGAGYLIEPDVTVLVEYKTLGSDTYQIIPIEAQGAIAAYAMYTLNLQREPGKAQFFMNEFRRLARVLKSRYVPARPLELLNSFMYSRKSTIK